jgi:ribosomal protein S19E (S16A)
MALVKKDVSQLLAQLESLGIVEKVTLDGSVCTDN